ncbi:ABC transporter substrate-binding protein [Enterococcus olivae]
MRKIKMVLLFLGMVFLSACSEEKTTSFTLANWSQLIVEQTSILAEEEHGFFNEQGIDLTVIPGNGGQDALKNMLTGQADIAFTDPGAVYSALAQGEDLVILYTVYPQNVFNVVTTDPDIQTPADLKEKTIGIYSRASGTYQNLLVLLYQAGLSEEDVQLLEVGISNFAPLLQGEVDATAATDTALVPARRAGLTDARIFEVRDSLNIPSDFFVVKRSTFEENAEVLRDFVAAYEKSAQWMLDDPEQAAELAGNLAIDGRETEINREIIDLRNAASLDQNGELGVMDIEMIQAGADAYFELGLIPERLEMTNYIEDIKE